MKPFNRNDVMPLGSKDNFFRVNAIEPEVALLLLFFGSRGALIKVLFYDVLPVYFTGSHKTETSKRS